MTHKMRDFITEAISSVKNKGEEVMSCWNGRLVRTNNDEGEIVGDYWDGTNLTGATRMILVACPSKGSVRDVHIVRLDAVEFIK